MEGSLILLVVVLVLSGPAALVLVLLGWSRLRAIERELGALRSGSGERPATVASPRESGTAPSPPAPSPAPVPLVGVPPLPARAPEGTPAPGPVEPRRRDLEARIGGEWLTWIGVSAIFFGTAFFLAVPLGNHPLAGVGQVAIGIGVAFGFLFSGLWLSGRTRWFLAQGLLGGGTALVFLAIFAAAAFHRLIGATPSYFLLAGAAVLGALLAIARRSRTVVGLTLAGALVAPIVLEPRVAHPLFFPYLLFVGLGTAIVRLRMGWPGLVLAAYLGTLLHVVLWWERFFGPDARLQALAGVGALWLLYWGLPLLVRPSSLGWRLAGTGLVFANAGSAAWFLERWLGRWDLLQGPLTAGIGALLGATALLPAARRRADLALSYELAAFALGALAVPIHFDLGTVTLGWSLLAIALLHLGLVRRSPGHRYLGYALLVLSAGHHVLFHLAGRIDPGREETSWVPGLLVVAALLAAAAMLVHARRADQADPDRPRRLQTWEARSPTPLVLAAAGFLFYVVSSEIWIGLADHGERRQQVGLSLSWALYGGLLIAIGFLARFRPLRLAGVGLLLLLVAKVFVVDMSVLDRGERIASFVGVGVLLLVISILYQRRRT